MAGIDPTIDPRGARWESRLRPVVLGAAWLAVPTVFLYFSKLEGALAIVAVSLAWTIWIVFVAETAIMLAVARDRRAWARGHLFGIAIVVATFPLLTQILEGLLAARALSSLQGVRVLQVLYIAKAAKLIKTALILRTRGHVPRSPLLQTVVLLAGSALLVGIGDRISGDKHVTPLHGTWDVVIDLPAWGTALVAAGAAAALLAALTAQRAR